MATTKHTCGGPTFGRKTPGCPRCDELIAGAAPVQWRTRTPELTYAAHSCIERRCGVVCTAGEW